MNTAHKIGLLPGFGWITDHSFIPTLIICWLITPGLMLIIAPVLEGRMLPVTFDRQFYAFFPGDFFLGGMMTGLLMVAKSLPPQNALYNRVWFHVLVLIVTITVAMLMTRAEYVDPNGYGHRAVLSPTKLYHNILLYGGYGYIIVVTLVAVVWNIQSVDKSIFLLSMVAGLVWVSLLILDGKVDQAQQRSRVKYAHINTWHPFWSH